MKILNVDDPYGRRLADEFPEATTFGIDADAHYRAVDVRSGFAGTDCTFVTPDGEFDVHVPLPGRFNVANALGAWAAARSLGVELTRAAGRPCACPGASSRSSRASRSPCWSTTRTRRTRSRTSCGRRASSPTGRVIAVFGAGGDRDRGKRPLMGEIGARLADVCLVTSDNPRSEDPEAIIAEILAGHRRRGERRADPDRRASIHRAVALAEPGDVVVIAGKGHEQGQEFEGGRKEPFDDVTVAREALRSVAPA